MHGRSPTLQNLQSAFNPMRMWLRQASLRGPSLPREGYPPPRTLGTVLDSCTQAHTLIMTHRNEALVSERPMLDSQSQLCRNHKVCSPLCFNHSICSQPEDACHEVTEGCPPHDKRGCTDHGLGRTWCYANIAVPSEYQDRGHLGAVASFELGCEHTRHKITCQRLAC